MVLRKKRKGHPCKGDLNLESKLHKAPFPQTLVQAMSAKARKVEDKERNRQEEIVGAIRNSTRLNKSQKEALLSIIPYVVRYGCCRMTDAQLANIYGTTRESSNRRLKSIEKLGLIRRIRTQVHYTKRLRKIFIRWSTLWKYLGIRCKNRKRKKRHIDTTYSLSKEKHLNSPSTKAGPSAFKMAFDLVRPNYVRIGTKLCLELLRNGRLTKDVLEDILKQLTLRGLNTAEIGLIKINLKTMG